MKMRLFGNTTKKANDKDNAKIKMVEVSQLRFDRDFKNVFQQENDKVAEIANDMKGIARSYFQNDKTCRVSNTYTLYYKGQFGDKLDVYSDFSINNYRNNYTNQYSDLADGF